MSESEQPRDRSKSGDLNGKRTPNSCPHRINTVAHSDGGEDANCGLLMQLTGVASDVSMRVSRDACEACCSSFTPSQHDLNPVIASLLFEQTNQFVHAGGVAGCDVKKATELNVWAERSLPAVQQDEDDSLDIGEKSYEHLTYVTADDIALRLPRPDPDAGETRTEIASWCVGVTTAPRRLPTLEKCVRSIQSAGWENPILFIDGDVGLPESLSGLNSCHRKPALGAFPNFVLSLSEMYMREPHADAYMIIQDDAQFIGSKAVREYVESVLWHDTGPCIASLYCSSKYNQPDPGWSIFPGTWIWGAVAFVFSREAARQFLNSSMVLDHRALPDNQGLTKVDVVVGWFAKVNKIPIVFPCPSLVQHIGTISTLWSAARAVSARQANKFIGDEF